MQRRAPAASPAGATATTGPATVEGAATPLPATTVTPAPTVAPQAFVPSYAERFGVTGFAPEMGLALDLGLPFTSYLDWHVRAVTTRPQQLAFWQMIRLRDEQIYTPYEEIDRALAAKRGATWLIGNEPDVVVQDNVTPQRYAELYHELYTYIKARDSQARIAIGGVSQPTPLRRAYLDIVLDSYERKYGQPMPIDVWNVHGFILREEKDEWGIGIPPGMDDDLAMHYEIDDHGDLEIFARNLIDFRAWMAQRGYGDRPLLLSEFGFLMPYDFGYTPQDAVAFLEGSFDFLLNARNETGFAPDDGRLVQWWTWFILYETKDEFATAFLYDGERRQLTELGEAYRAFVRENQP